LKDKSEFTEDGNAKKREYTFALRLSSEETVIMAAKDKKAYQAWLTALQGIIKAIKARPQDFNLQ